MLYRAEPIVERSTQIYLGLGSSLGDRCGNLEAAIARLRRDGLKILDISSVYESPHLGQEPGDDRTFPPHLNLAVRAGTSLSPDAVLDLTQRVEREGGRVHHERWSPRTIDIDLLAYDGIVLESDRLSLPHPEIARRAFVVRPLMDIAPDFQFPDGTYLREVLDSEPLRSQQIAVVSSLNLNLRCAPLTATRD